MKHGSHADDGGCIPHLVAHGVLSLIYVGKHRGQGTVVPDGAAQNIGDVVLLQAVDDAIVDFLFFNELRDGTMIPDPVQQVQVVVVAVGLVLGGVNVLAQGSM